MAHQPTWRTDPSGHPQSAAEKSSQPSEPAWIGEGGAVQLAELVATLASHGVGAASTDLALDLLLNEIVEQACLATTATGAAIALVRGDEMVCRATTGPNAPDLGVRLNTQSGLSGACVLTREVQRCGDTESDPRVDAASCRLLEVRSILVLPLLKEGELLGVIEIFSGRADAFGDRDIQTLQALSRRVVDNIQRAAEAAASPPVADPATAAVSVHENQAEPAAPPAELERKAPDGRVHPHDYWTGALTAIVIGLALFLGWVVGRAAWRAALSIANPQTGVTSPAQESKDAPTVEASNANARPTRPAAAKQPVGSAVPIPPKTKGASGETRSGTGAPAAGSLTVYENGKIIFQMTPPEKSHYSRPGLPTEAARRDATTDESHTPPPAKPIPVSPETASTYLIDRVEPQYPEQAREQHIQGPVVVDALVDKDGAVEVLKVVSGDPQLVLAATDAVRHWRFKPYRPHGQPVGFETRITVNFTLP